MLVKTPRGTSIAPNRTVPDPHALPTSFSLPSPIARQEREGWSRKQMTVHPPRRSSTSVSSGEKERKTAAKKSAHVGAMGRVGSAGNASPRMTKGKSPDPKREEAIRMPDKDHDRRRKPKAASVGGRHVPPSSSFSSSRPYPTARTQKEKPPPIFRPPSRTIPPLPISDTSPLSSWSRGWTKTVGDPPRSPGQGVGKSPEMDVERMPCPPRSKSRRQKGDGGGEKDPSQGMRAMTAEGGFPSRPHRRTPSTQDFAARRPPPRLTAFWRSDRVGGAVGHSWNRTGLAPRSPAPTKSPSRHFRHEAEGKEGEGEGRGEEDEGVRSGGMGVRASTMTAPFSSSSFSSPLKSPVSLSVTTATTTAEESYCRELPSSFTQQTLTGVFQCQIKSTVGFESIQGYRNRFVVVDGPQHTLSIYKNDQSLVPLHMYKTARLRTVTYTAEKHSRFFRVNIRTLIGDRIRLLFETWEERDRWGRLLTEMIDQVDAFHRRLRTIQLVDRLCEAAMRKLGEVEISVRGERFLYNVSNALLQYVPEAVEKALSTIEEVVTRMGLARPPAAYQIELVVVTGVGASLTSRNGRPSAEEKRSLFSRWKKDSSKGEGEGSSDDGEWGRGLEGRGRSNAMTSTTNNHNSHSNSNNNSSGGGGGGGESGGVQYDPSSRVVIMQVRLLCPTSAHDRLGIKVPSYSDVEAIVQSRIYRDPDIERLLDPEENHMTAFQAIRRTLWPAFEPFPSHDPSTSTPSPFSEVRSSSSFSLLRKVRENEKMEKKKKKMGKTAGVETKPDAAFSPLEENPHLHGAPGEGTSPLPLVTARTTPPSLWSTFTHHHRTPLPSTTTTTTTTMEMADTAVKMEADRSAGVEPAMLLPIPFMSFQWDQRCDQLSKAVVKQYAQTFFNPGFFQHVYEDLTTGFYLLTKEVLEPLRSRHSTPLMPCIEVVVKEPARLFHGLLKGLSISITRDAVAASALPSVFLAMTPVYKEICDTACLLQAVFIHSLGKQRAPRPHGEHENGEFEEMLSMEQTESTGHGRRRSLSPVAVPVLDPSSSPFSTRPLSATAKRSNHKKSARQEDGLPERRPLSSSSFALSSRASLSYVGTAPTAAAPPTYMSGGALPPPLHEGHETRVHTADGSLSASPVLTTPSAAFSGSFYSNSTDQGGFALSFPRRSTSSRYHHMFQELQRYSHGGGGGGSENAYANEGNPTHTNTTMHPTLHSETSLASQVWSVGLKVLLCHYLKTYRKVLQKVAAPFEVIIHWAELFDVYGVLVRRRGDGRGGGGRSGPTPSWQEGQGSSPTPTPATITSWNAPRSSYAWVSHLWPSLLAVLQDVVEAYAERLGQLMDYLGRKDNAVLFSTLHYRTAKDYAQEEEEERGTAGGEEKPKKKKKKQEKETEASLGSFLSQYVRWISVGFSIFAPDHRLGEDGLTAFMPSMYRGVIRDVLLCRWKEEGSGSGIGASSSSSSGFSFSKDAGKSGGGGGGGRGGGMATTVHSSASHFSSPPRTVAGHGSSPSSGVSRGRPHHPSLVGRRSSSGGGGGGGGMGRGWGSPVYPPSPPLPGGGMPLSSSHTPPQAVSGGPGKEDASTLASETVVLQFPYGRVAITPAAPDLGKWCGEFLAKAMEQGSLELVKDLVEKPFIRDIFNREEKKKKLSHRGSRRGRHPKRRHPRREHSQPTEGPHSHRFHHHRHSSSFSSFSSVSSSSSHRLHRTRKEESDDEDDSESRSERSSLTSMAGGESTTRSSSSSSRSRSRRSSGSGSSSSSSRSRTRRGTVGRGGDGGGPSGRGKGGGGGGKFRDGLLHFGDTVAMIRYDEVCRIPFAQVRNTVYDYQGDDARLKITLDDISTALQSLRSSLPDWSMYLHDAMHILLTNLHHLRGLFTQYVKEDATERARRCLKGVAGLDPAAGWGGGPSSATTPRRMLSSAGGGGGGSLWSASTGSFILPLRKAIALLTEYCEYEDSSRRVARVCRMFCRVQRLDKLIALSVRQPFSVLLWHFCALEEYLRTEKGEETAGEGWRGRRSSRHRRTSTGIRPEGLAERSRVFTFPPADPLPSKGKGAAPSTSSVATRHPGGVCHSHHTPCTPPENSSFATSEGEANKGRRSGEEGAVGLRRRTPVVEEEEDDDEEKPLGLRTTQRRLSGTSLISISLATPTRSMLDSFTLRMSTQGGGGGREKRWNTRSEQSSSTMETVVPNPPGWYHRQNTTVVVVGERVQQHHVREKKATVGCLPWWGRKETGEEGSPRESVTDGRSGSGGEAPEEEQQQRGMEGGSSPNGWGWQKDAHGIRRSNQPAFLERISRVEASSSAAGGSPGGNRWSGGESSSSGGGGGGEAGDHRRHSRTAVHFSPQRQRVDTKAEDEVDTRETEGKKTPPCYPPGETGKNAPSFAAIAAAAVRERQAGSSEEKWNAQKNDFPLQSLTSFPSALEKGGPAGEKGKGRSGGGGAGGGGGVTEVGSELVRHGIYLSPEQVETLHALYKECILPPSRVKKEPRLFGFPIITDIALNLLLPMEVAEARRARRIGLLFGLDRTGKTLICNCLRGVVQPTVATVGMQEQIVSFGRWILVMQELGGRECFRQNWRYYVERVSPMTYLIFCIDAQNRVRMKECQQYLKEVLDFFPRLPLLMIFNNFPQVTVSFGRGSVSKPQEVLERGFRVTEMRKTRWVLVVTCDVTLVHDTNRCIPSSLQDGFDSLTDFLHSTTPFNEIPSMPKESVSFPVEKEE